VSRTYSAISRCCRSMTASRRSWASWMSLEASLLRRAASRCSSGARPSR